MNENNPQRCPKCGNTAVRFGDTYCCGDDSCALRSVVLSLSDWNALRYAKAEEEEHPKKARRMLGGKEHSLNSRHCGVHEESISCKHAGCQPVEEEKPKARGGGSMKICDNCGDELPGDHAMFCSSLCEAAYRRDYWKDRSEKAEAEVERLRAQWIPVSQRLPDSNVPVLATVRWKFDGEWRYRVIRAQFAKRHTLPSAEECDIGEYNEGDGEYYAAEGWYEDNWEEEIHWRVTDEVTHWMPLPAAGRGEGE